MVTLHFINGAFFNFSMQLEPVLNDNLPINLHVFCFIYIPGTFPFTLGILVACHAFSIDLFSLFFPATVLLLFLPGRGYRQVCRALRFMPPCILKGTLNTQIKLGTIGFSCHMDSENQAMQISKSQNKMTGLDKCIANTLKWGTFQQL